MKYILIVGVVGIVACSGGGASVTSVPPIVLDTATIAVTNNSYLRDTLYVAYPTQQGWHGPILPGTTRCLTFMEDANVMAVDNAVWLAYWQSPEGIRAIWVWRPQLGTSPGWHLQIDNLSSQPSLKAGAAC